MVLRLQRAVKHLPRNAQPSFACCFHYTLATSRLDYAWDWEVLANYGKKERQEEGAEGTARDCCEEALQWRGCERAGCRC
jgi:hypothetical protein